MKTATRRDYLRFLMIILVLGVVFFMMSPKSSINEPKELFIFNKEGDVEKTHPDTQGFFNEFNKDTMHLVDEFYDEDIIFRDPLVNIEGRDELKKYYADMYKNVESIEFEFADDVLQDNTQVVVWTMKVKAKSLNRGKEVTVKGVSHIKFGGAEGKAVYHRDYFDLGEFVYEYVPVVGGMVRYIKNRMSKAHQ